jgi:hypothetical protein
MTVLTFDVHAHRGRGYERDQDAKQCDEEADQADEYFVGQGGGRSIVVGWPGWPGCRGAAMIAR